MADQYVKEHAKRKNRSWKQADTLVRRYLIPKWGKIQANSIFRSDAKAMMTSIKAPILANQVLGAASAIFSWGIREEIVKLNPCALVDRNETKSRERVLSDSEIPKFWKAFDITGLMQSTALKMILLATSFIEEAYRFTRTDYPGRQFKLDRLLDTSKASRI